MVINAGVTVTIEALWFAYLNASVAYEELAKRWRYVASVSRADGTAGMLYAQLYTAEMAKDAAYTAWARAYAEIAGSHSYNPGYGADQGTTG
jgi:hypothetical protein